MNDKDKYLYCSRILPFYRQQRSLGAEIAAVILEEINNQCGRKLDANGTYITLPTYLVNFLDTHSDKTAAVIESCRDELFAHRIAFSIAQGTGIVARSHHPAVIHEGKMRKLSDLLNIKKFIKYFDNKVGCKIHVCTKKECEDLSKLRKEFGPANISDEFVKNHLFLHTESGVTYVSKTDNVQVVVIGK